MFVGCPALAGCPRRLVTEALGCEDLGRQGLGRQDPGRSGMGRHSADHQGAGRSGVGLADADLRSREYNSPFRSWYERSAVHDATRELFSPHLVPVAAHPLVRRLDPAVYQRLLVHHLYRYLDFTARLEHLVVNQTVLGIAHGTLGVRLPDEMRFDAFKIYCDEAYHALFCADLARQVEAATGVAPALPAEPYFLRRLAELRASRPERARPLVDLIFVVVSETLISATLAELPDDLGVAGAVREVLRDHLSDEARHHRYFALFLRELWGQLDPAGRREAALLVPALIDCFLDPDTGAVSTDLRATGLRPDDVDLVLAEVFASATVREQRWLTTRPLVRYLTVLGVLDDPEAAAAFAEHGLL